MVKNNDCALHTKEHFGLYGVYVFMLNLSYITPRCMNLLIVSYLARTLLVKALFNTEAII